VARTFQNIGLDKQATVLDNLRVAREGGALIDEMRMFFGARNGNGSPNGNGNGLAAEAVDLLERLGLREVVSERVDQLPVGTAKLVELVCAVLRRPRLLLLDEPSLGLAPLVVREIFEILARLNEQEGLTVLVVEQNAAIALRTCHEACVLEVGRVVVAGESAVLREHESVRRSYLGY
jgi:ABC-type branched-subunit amino acid transport system ATPase component